MTLRDRLYLRFGLMHKAYWARFIAAFVEGLLIGAVVLGLMLTLYGAARIITWVYYSHVAEAARVQTQRAERERIGYEKIVLACLNKQWFIANGELMTCEVK